MEQYVTFKITRDELSRIQRGESVLVSSDYAIKKWNGFENRIRSRQPEQFRSESFLGTTIPTRKRF